MVQTDWADLCHAALQQRIAGGGAHHHHEDHYQGLQTELSLVGHFLLVSRCRRLKTLVKRRSRASPRRRHHAPTSNVPRAASKIPSLRGTDACARDYPTALLSRCAIRPWDGNNIHRRNGLHPTSSRPLRDADTQCVATGVRPCLPTLLPSGNPPWPWNHIAPCRAWHGRGRPG